MTNYRIVSIDALIDRMEEESINYILNECHTGEYFNVSLPMMSNFIDELNIKIVLFENGNLQYESTLPITIKQGEGNIGLQIVNELNSHNQITGYHLEEKQVVEAKYVIKTNGVLMLSTDYILSTAYHFAETIDESLCRIFCR